jgi:hypothetical protein
MSAVTYASCVFKSMSCKARPAVDLKLVLRNFIINLVYANFFYLFCFVFLFHEMSILSAYDGVKLTNLTISAVFL